MNIVHYSSCVAVCNRGLVVALTNAKFLSPAPAGAGDDRGLKPLIIYGASRRVRNVLLLRHIFSTLEY